MAESLGSAVLDLRTDDTNFSRGIDGAKRKAVGLQRTFDQTGRKLQSFGKRTREVGSSVTTGLSLPLAVAGGAMLKSSGDIQRGMIGIQKTTGLADKQIASLKKDILDFASANNVTINSLLETGKVAGQMGIEGSKAIGKFTKAFSKLEVASDRTVAGEFGAQAFAKFLDLTGEGVDAADEMGSALVKLGNTSKTTEGRILELSREIVSRSARFGIAGADILGFATALDEAGVQSQRAASTFQMFFNELDKAVKSGSENLDRFVQVTGLSVERIKELMRTDPGEVMIAFSEGLDKMNMSGEDTATLLEDMGLGAQRVSSVLQVMATRTDSVREKVSAANDAQRENVALQREAEAANRGFNAAMQMLVNSLRSLGDAIASAGVLDFLTNGVRRVTEWVGQLADLNPAILKWSAAVIAVGAALGPVILAVGALSTAVGTLGIALSGSLGIWGAVAAAVALFLTKTKTGRVVLGWFAAAFDIIVQSGKDVARWLGPWIDTTVAWLSGFVSDSIEAFRRFDETVAAILKGVGDLYNKWIVEPLRSALKAGANLIAGFIDTLLSIGSYLPGVGDDIKGLKSDFDDWRRSLGGATGAAGDANDALEITITKTARVRQNMADLAVFPELFGAIADKTTESADAATDMQTNFADMAAFPEMFTSIAETSGDAAEGVGEMASEFETWSQNFRTDSQRLNTFRKKLEFLNRLFREGKISVATYDNAIRQASQGLSDMVRTTDNVADTQDKANEKQTEGIELWKSTDQIAKDTITGIRDAWVNMWDDALHGKIDSVKSFLKSIGDLFLSTIAQIAAAWSASAIFGIGDFSLGNLGGIFGGGGSGGGGLLNLGSVASGASKLFGGGGLLSGGVSGIMGAIKGSGALGAVEAGTGATASLFGGMGGLSGLASIAGPAALGIGGVLAAKEIFGGGPSDFDIASKNFAGGKGAAAGVGGAQLTRAKGTLFAKGGISGFAAGRAQDAGIAAQKMEGGMAAFPGINEVSQLKTLLESAQRAFTKLKQVATDAFRGAGVSARQMGQMLQDGVIDKSERAQLQIKGIGTAIENPRSGMKKLGDISTKQFRRLSNAVNRGEIRFDALTGKVGFTQSELQVLGKIGLTTADQLMNGASRAANAEKNLGNTTRSVMNGIKSSATQTASGMSQSFTRAANDASKGINRFANTTRDSLGRISGAARGAQSAIAGIPGAASSAASKARSALGSIRSGARSAIPHMAEGGIVTQPTLAVIGEAGPEAVVPLDGKNGGAGMQVTINQNISGVTADEVQQQTERALNRYAFNWPTR